MNCKKFQKPLGLVSEEKSKKLLRNGAAKSGMNFENEILFKEGRM